MRPSCSGTQIEIGEPRLPPFPPRSLRSKRELWFIKEAARLETLERLRKKYPWAFSRETSNCRTDRPKPRPLNKKSDFRRLRSLGRRGLDPYAKVVVRLCDLLLPPFNQSRSPRLAVRLRETYYMLLETDWPLIAPTWAPYNPHLGAGGGH